MMHTHAQAHADAHTCDTLMPESIQCVHARGQQKERSDAWFPSVRACTWAAEGKVARVGHVLVCQSVSQGDRYLPALQLNPSHVPVWVWFGWRRWWRMRAGRGWRWWLWTSAVFGGCVAWKHAADGVCMGDGRAKVWAFECTPRSSSVARGNIHPGYTGQQHLAVGGACSDSLFVRRVLRQCDPVRDIPGGIARNISDQSHLPHIYCMIVTT